MKKLEDFVTLKRAKRIRHWRVNQGCTWRKVANNAYEQWAEIEDWSPPNNQIIGMELCKIAAKMLKEDPSTYPWN